MIKLGKAKKKDSSSSQSGGRSIASYFMPVLVACVVVVAALVMVSKSEIDSSVDEANHKLATTTADSLVWGITEIINSRKSLLNLLGAQQQTREALASADEAALRELGKRYAAQIEGVDEVILVANTARPDGSFVGEQGSYAAADMIRRVIRTGRVVNVEAHQLDTRTPIIAIAVPVLDGEKVLGAVYSNNNVDMLRKRVDAMSNARSAFAINQKAGGKRASLYSAKQFKDGSGVVRTSIPGTSWEVAIMVGAIDIDAIRLMAIGLLVLLVVAMLLFWVQGRLDKDLTHDLELVKELTGSVLKRSGSATVVPKLADTQEVVEGLNALAKANYVSAKMAEHDAPTPEQEVANELNVDVPAVPAVEAATIGELPESIFRAYDIRGVVGDTLTNDIAQLLGQALGTMAQEHGEKALIIGRDVRLSSQDLAEGLAAGILSTGCDVIDLGEVPTPLVYYATNTLQSHSGIMVTGSHNPPEYNGFKIVMGGQPLAEQGLQDLRERMLMAEFKSGKGSMSQKHQITSEYIRRISEDVQLAEPRKVVVDGGNGVAGPLMVELLRELGCEVIELFCEPDGNFPNHHPDPGKPENLASLVLEVQAQQADVGLALDGDGDRLGVVDNSGKLVSPDMLIMLLASDILQRHPGVDIVYDVKSSAHLASHILSNGGRPIMWKTGHTRIKAKMKETGALLGGEFSGHIFIKERWFGFDDGAYTAARLMEILCADPQPVAKFFADLPRSVSTSEIQMDFKEGENFALMETMKQNADFGDANVIDIDGLRVEYPDGWGLVRPSNTTPALIFRFEGKSKMSLDEIKGRFRSLLENVAPGREIPF
ncbi:MAG: phosphomannomutase/phosphoglucomutase [bacterium]